MHAIGVDMVQGSLIHDPEPLAALLPYRVRSTSSKQLIGQEPARGLVAHPKVEVAVLTAEATDCGGVAADCPDREWSQQRGPDAVKVCVD